MAWADRLFDVDLIVLRLNDQRVSQVASSAPHETARLRVEPVVSALGARNSEHEHPVSELSLSGRSPPAGVLGGRCDV